jgi:chemotaxis signal transduction protein
VSAKGWLLSMRGPTYAAVGARELVYVLPEEPQIQGIPLAPAPAPGVIVWENRPVPVIDVGLLLRGAEAGAASAATAPGGRREFAAIVAFTGDRAGNAGVELGALILTKVPEQIEVSDDQAREIPDEFIGHGGFFTSCFEHPELGAVPVLDLAAMFLTSVRRCEIGAPYDVQGSLS